MKSDTVPAPLRQACNTTSYYYDCRGHLPLLSSFNWNHDVDDQRLSPLCTSVITISVLYVSRIGEVLHLKVKDVCHPDRVICYGSKRSNGYMLYLPGLSSQIKKWRQVDKHTPLFPVSYMKVYRACISAGILQNDGTGGNSKVCHAHRYLFARSHVNSVGKRGLKIALHHKTVLSQEFYLEKDKESSIENSKQTSLSLQ